jgi:hypothetical protein
MPHPCNLSDDQWAVYISDPDMRAAFPGIPNGNALHLSQTFGFGEFWERERLKDPERMRKAIEKATGRMVEISEVTGAKPQEITKSIPLNLEETALTLEALENIKKAADNLSKCIDKYKELHPEVED